MTDGRIFQQYFKPMLALGRKYQLGDFYDQRSDRIVKDEQLSWKPSTLASATEVVYRNKISKKLSKDAEFTNNSKKDSMSLDDHLMASVMAGLVDNPQGASNFLNSLPDPRETTVTLSWTFQSKEERLELELLIDQQGIPPLPDVPENKEISDATHVVVGVLYGSQAYCVLAQNLNSEENEEARDEAQENLSKLAKKFEDAMELGQDVAKFKEEINKDGKPLLTRLKCRLYSDFQTLPVRSCNLFDAYHHCDMLAKHTRIGSDKAVPISVLLCPLNILFNPAGGIVSAKFGVCRDVGEKLVTRCCRIFGDLNRVVIKANKLCDDANKGPAERESLREFVRTISQYQDLLKKNLRSKIISDRSSILSVDYNVETLADKAENHFYFKPSHLERWLNFKRNELDTMDSLASATGNRVTFLVDQLSSNKKYALVLFIPLPNEWTNAVLSSMKTCIDEEESNERRSSSKIGKRQFNAEPWYMNPSKQRFVLDMIRDLANYAEKNKDISSQVEFIVTFRESNKRFGCSYSVYEGEKLLRSNLYQLPAPPTGLRIVRIIPCRKRNKKGETTSSSIQVEWDYEDLGIPCQFLIEYRAKFSFDPWIQQRTTEPGQTQLAISFPTGTTIEIRVAAETCIGRSDLSEVINTDNAFDEGDVDGVFANCSKVNEEMHLRPPSGLKVKSVNHDSVKLEWKPPPGDYCCLQYRFNYWKKEEEVSSVCIEDCIDVDATEWCLDDLDPETTYLLNMVTIVDDHLNRKSNPSEALEFTTAKRIRFAETLVKRSQKVGKKNGLDLYAVPLAKWPGQPTIADRFVFDPDGESERKIDWPLTILLVGASGSGKASLINCLINYIFHVNLEDPFRFQLIDPSQAESRISVYDIHYNDGFCTILNSLKIIDTPSYVDNDPAKNQEITEMIRNFFEGRNIIRNVEVVGFVLDSTFPQLTPLQLYIYSSLITIFGSDVTEKITFLFTSCDNVDNPPPLLSAVEKAFELPPAPGENNRRYNFDNSVYFSPNKGRGAISSESFLKWIEHFHSFFVSAAWFSSTSVILSEQALQKRNQLESIINGLDKRMEMGIAEFENLRALSKKLRHNFNIEKFKFEWNMFVAIKEPLPLGMSVTNCNSCRVTCHTICGADDKFRCDVMDHFMPEKIRTCLVCPGKCLWKKHSNDSFTWSYQKKKQPFSYDSIKKHFETRLKKTLTVEEIVEAVGAHMQMKQQIVLNLIITIVNLLNRLRTIANRLELQMPSQYIDIFEIVETIDEFISNAIRYEKKGRRRDFQTRIEKLQHIRRVAIAMKGVPSRIHRYYMSDSDEVEDEVEEN